MRPTPSLFKNVAPISQNLIQIRNGTFYRHHPSDHDSSSAVNLPLYSDLTFELPAKHPQEHWAILGRSSATTFLEILQGKHICIPPNARSFPHLFSDEIEKKDHRLRTPSRAIQYVGFNGGKGPGQDSGIRGAYLSARYESHREETDWSVLQYLRGETQLNPAESEEGRGGEDTTLLARVIRDLRMEKLVSMPVSNLSNGQTRRARIAKALLGKPELLLLDGPFMGLDPPTLVTLSPILEELAHNASPRLLLALRPQDPVPDWITHLIIMGDNNTITLIGEKAEVLFRLHRWADLHAAIKSEGHHSLPLAMARAMTQHHGPPLQEFGHSLSSGGISTYDAYAAAKSAGFFDRSTGFMKTSLLDESAALRQRNAMKTIRRIVPTQPTYRRPLRNIETIPLSSLLDATVLLPDPAKLEKSAPLAIERAALEVEPGKQHDASNTSNAAKMTEVGAPLIEMSSVVIKYGGKTVLGYPPPQKGYSEPGLNLTIRQGGRIALLGPNGSGKTTLLSLLTSDHPHSYSLPIKFFGRSRLPSVGTIGMSLFEIQSRIGHSSPEIHAFFPKHLTIRQTLESAWSETYSAKPRLNYTADETIDVFLKWWEPELKPTSLSSGSISAEATAVPVKHYMPTSRQRVNIFRKRALFRCMEQSIPPPLYPELPWLPTPAEIDTKLPQPRRTLDWAENTRFGDLEFGTQRLLLLLRALVKKPDIVVLDEAFSGLSPDTRDKAMLWLEHGQQRFTTLRATKTGPSANKYVRTVKENQRHLFDAMCVFVGKSEEEVMQAMRHAHPKGRLFGPIRMIQDDAELEERAKEWNVDQDVSYRFRGLRDTQALVVVSHVKEEVPGFVDQWIRLPSEEEVLENGRGVEMGDCPNGEIRTAEGWNRVWGL